MYAQVVIQSGVLRIAWPRIEPKTKVTAVSTTAKISTVKAPKRGSLFALLICDRVSKKPSSVRDDKAESIKSASRKLSDRAVRMTDSPTEAINTQATGSTLPD